MSEDDRVCTKALIRDRFGPPEVLRLEEVEEPVPAGEDVLVEVYASSLNKADLYSLSTPAVLRPLTGNGVRRPKTVKLGGDLAGRVKAVGKDVRELRPGDEVYGLGRGAFAEFALARQGRLAPKPANLTFEEAAAVPIAGVTALQGLRKGGISAGQKVLIDGGSGGVGTFAIQVSKSFGAEVTVVCSEGNMEVARSLGADHVVDYKKEDFAKAELRYDFILGVNGDHSLFSYRRALSPTGVYLMAGSHKPLSGIIQMSTLGRLLSRKNGRRLSFMGITDVTKDDLQVLKGLIEQGKVRPYIEKRYPLAEGAEAFRQIATGHAKGKISIVIKQ